MNARIRALTCNLHSGRASPAALINLINTEEIDIVCAQELSIGLAEALSGELPFGNMSHVQICGGNGIASRHPVEMARIQMPKRDGWVARLSPHHWQGLPFLVELVNVHISGPHLWPYFPHPVRRQAQLDALLADRERRPTVPHAILGDFNASPIWPVYKRMVAKYLDGALDAGKGKLGFQGTWPYMPWIGIKGLFRIDHCFLWNLSAERAHVVEIPGSDHLGLLVDINVFRGVDSDNQRM